MGVSPSVPLRETATPTARRAGEVNPKATRSGVERSERVYLAEHRATLRNPRENPRSHRQRGLEPECQLEPERQLELELELELERERER
jgi:hypothetical protein